MTKIGTRNVGYWINAVAQGQEDYYSKSGEAPGVWHGRLAGTLGLSGEVGHDDYMAIFAGQSPVTGEELLTRPAPRRWVDALGRNRKADPVLGYDLRFAAPKSVSLVWAIGDEEARGAVLAAHEKGVESALSYLEDVACWVQRGKGGAEYEPGRGFVGMGFLHRSSRAGDPALHTHMLISNMTRAVKDGKWMSLASPKGRMPLFLYAKAAGHVYQAVMRAEVTRVLGLEWGEVSNGYADLEGFDRELIEHFSRRREEIVTYMAERGDTSAAAAEIAAYRTRPSKEDIDIDRQVVEWVARAAEFGLTPGSIREMIDVGRAREPRSIDGDDLTAVLDDVEARHSHFGRRDLVCAVSGRMREGADAGAISRAVDAIVDGGRVVGLDPSRPKDASGNFTTARLAAMEEKLVAAAVGGKDAGAGVISAEELAGVLDRHAYLGDEQREMVRRLTTGGERIAVVAARPGTGKTTALRAAAQGWAAAGFRGIGVATARSATVEIADVGIPATSIAKLRLMLEERDEHGLTALPPGTVIVVDEASTAATEDLAMLLERVEACDGKLVLMGDTRQIGAVAAAGIYGDLANRVEVIELTTIRRQRDPVDREIVTLAHEGRGSDALDLMQASGRVRVASTHAEALDAIALDWLGDFTGGQDTVMIARRNEDVRRLNERARELREERGELGERTRVGGTEFAVGDVVMTRVNVPEVSNRERWTIVGVDRRERSVDIVKVGSPGVGATLSEEYLRRRSKDGAPAIEHAYAITTYASQGKTFDAVRNLLDERVNREDFLVGQSRARGRTTTYLVAARELVDGDLGPATREVSDELHDVRIGGERIGSEYAGVEVEPRARIAAMPARELARRRLGVVNQLREVDRPEVAGDRRAALDSRIETARERLASLAEARADAGDHAEALATISGKLRQGERQLSRLEADRDGLGPNTRKHPKAEQVEALRYELRHIEERVAVLARQAARAELVEPTRAVVDSLGPRPEDPEKIEAWDEGVQLIHQFRVRWGIEGSETKPFGEAVGVGRSRIDHEEASNRLVELQSRLLFEGPDRPRSVDVELSR